MSNKPGKVRPHVMEAYEEGVDRFEEVYENLAGIKPMSARPSVHVELNEVGHISQHLMHVILYVNGVPIDLGLMDMIERIALEEDLWQAGTAVLESVPYAFGEE